MVISFPICGYAKGKEKIYLDSSWKYADHARITSGYAVMYKAKKNRKDIVIAVNAGHGTKGGSSVKTLCHPDGSAKVTGGTTAAGSVKAVADGMAFRDGTAERDVTLRMARILKKKLLAEGYDVLMVRDGKDVRPQVSLVMNFSKPTATKPSLLTFDEVTTLLHEFGHSLHGMLSRNTYNGTGGTNVYRDFVELPSQIMENWALEKEWLDKWAVHYETGEKIPQEYIEKIRKSANFLSGYLSDRQLSFGMVDMAWHTITAPVTDSIVDFERKAMQPTEIFPDVEGTCFSTAFGHIFGGGYAAGYYSYKWAEVLDADAFSVFKKNGIFDAATAEAFRKNILEKGGSEHPMTLYVRFRGQKPTVDALLERSGLK